MVFWFRLALMLGRTVRELQRSMTASEFADWRAYYELEPFGPPVDDVRFARLCQLQTSQKTLKPFLLCDAGKQRRQSPAEVDARLMAWMKVEGWKKN